MSLSFMFSNKNSKAFFSAPVLQHASSIHFPWWEKNNMSFILGSNILLRNAVCSAVGLFFSTKVRDKFHLHLACNFDPQRPLQIYTFRSNWKWSIIDHLLRFHPALCWQAVKIWAPFNFLTYFQTKFFTRNSKNFLRAVGLISSFGTI